MIGAAGGMGLWAARHWFAELDDVTSITLCDVEPLTDDARKVLSDAAAGIDYVRAGTAGPSGLSLVDWEPVRTACDVPTVPPQLDQMDLVALAVPLSAIGAVMDGLSGRVTPGAWLIDMASVKGAPLKEMLEKAGDGVSVVGTHPLFGITGDSLAGRTVVLVPTESDDGDLLGWLGEGLAGLGANTMQVTADRHDRYMLIAQTMTHFALLAFGDAVTRSLRGDESLEELRQFGTPPYLAMGNVAGRLLTQNHRLYASIQQADGAEQIRESFARAAADLASSFNRGSLDDIEAEIDGLADRYGVRELSTSTRLSELMFQSGAIDPGEDTVGDDS
ncbi:MAG: prephenate dehydrogenase/arogenate dehydrogenase family protein [Dehalococcoidia bacterium]|jgi:prephenate dehydrogenase|nr:prephenate dehydrogenase/arogenate dehydrogenase family protein [Dehalococcoidia bacterium]